MGIPDKTPAPVRPRLLIGKINHGLFHACVIVALMASCRTLEKASMHGLSSGYYKFDTGSQTEKVYAEVSEEVVEIHRLIDGTPEQFAYRSLAMKATDSLGVTPFIFRKQSLDIDITSVPLKFRPSVYGVPHQLTSDLNVALYAGWRFDRYKLENRVNPLGKQQRRLSNLGYDIGFFAGPGATPINAATTLDPTTSEYSGMIVQVGLAGFLESNVASFGIAVGFDHLMNRDRNIWIYNRQPWVGFIVGVALN